MSERNQTTPSSIKPAQATDVNLIVVPMMIPAMIIQPLEYSLVTFCSPPRITLLLMDLAS